MLGTRKRRGAIIVLDGGAAWVCRKKNFHHIQFSRPCGKMDRESSPISNRVSAGPLRKVDVMFHEDGCQVRSKNGATNLAILRQIALNMIKAIPVSPTGSTKIKSRRMACAIEVDFLIKTLKGKGIPLNA